MRVGVEVGGTLTDLIAIYDLFYQKPVPVVARADTFEISERIAPYGTIVEPLDEHAATAIVDRVSVSRRHEAMSVCSLRTRIN